jgi:hypothetical protein
VVTQLGNLEWVFLFHRLPREPSAPRISLWRAVNRLGAVLVSDGLVALPASSRTLEHFEWLAAGIHENGGDASVWICRPSTRQVGERLAERARDSAESDYRELIREAAQASSAVVDSRRRALRRLRRQLHVVESRDFFGAPSRNKAAAAIEALARDKVPA